MRLKLLLIDHDALTPALVAVALEPLECEVRAFREAREAAALLESESFDAAIIDMEMPGMSGLELAGRIRSSARDRSIAIVLMRNAVQGEAALRGVYGGTELVIDLYLPTHRTPERLYSIYRALLRQIWPEK